MIPIQLIAGLGTALVSFFMKSQANALASVVTLAKLNMEVSDNASALADAAAKRSDPTARKIVAFFVTFIAFGGLLIVAFLPEIPVSIIQDVPQKSLLWGLIKWGREVDVITANGFVLPSWFGWTVSQIMGFLFGTGAAKGRG